MAAPLGTEPGTPNARIQASHDTRGRFESLAFIVGGSAVAASIAILLIGVIIPPPAPCVFEHMPHCTPLPDWGQAIVERMQHSWDAIVGMLATLAGWTGLTMTRGHLDTRLDQANPPNETNPPNPPSQ